MRNYYLHDKSVTVNIDNQTIEYVNKNIHFSISFSDIESIYKIEGKYINFIPYYYELNLKNGDTIYITFLLIENLAKVLGRKTHNISVFKMFLPNNE